MRTGAMNGTFALDGVQVLGVTPSTKSPQLIVQDQGGGDYSAIDTVCSSTSAQFPCSVATQVAAIPVGNAVALTGSFVTMAATQFERFYITSVTDQGPVGTPTALPLALTDVGATNNNPANWYQLVNVALSEPLVVYDLSPPAAARAGAVSCPYLFGWAMVPQSQLAGASVQACPAGNASQPASTGTNPAEILVETDFYRTFQVTSDCRCAMQFMDKLVTPQSTITGAIQGILMHDAPPGGTPNVYLAPQSATDAPLTNLM
jgi:hypothetical protein